MKPLNDLEKVFKWSLGNVGSKFSLVKKLDCAISGTVRK